MILYGTHPVIEALRRRPQQIHRVLLARQSGSGPREQIAAMAETLGIRVSLVSQQSLATMTRSDQHQGIAAEAEPFALLDIHGLLARRSQRSTRSFLLVLDSIQDPQNFGSLIRSAVCSGAQAVLFPQDRSAGLTGSVAKASAGAIEHISLCRVVNVVASLKLLKEQGIWAVGTLPHGGQMLYAADLSMDVAIVIGGEEKGIRPLVQRTCDFCVSIPMQAPFDSLNASVAGAVILFEVMRQRQPPPEHS
jgi:23S rRNA (guanosine2251-2'-O)-methyltransferase